MRVSSINHENDVKHKKGIVDSDYIKMKKQLSKYKVRAGEFKTQERQNEIKNENLILLSKMKQIQNGKQVSKTCIHEVISELLNLSFAYFRVAMDSKYSEERQLTLQRSIITTSF